MDEKELAKRLKGCFLCQFPNKYLVSGKIVSKNGVSFQATDPKIVTIQPMELDKNAVICPRCGFLHVFANAKEIKEKLGIKDN